jgi:hypothetical protein
MKELVEGFMVEGLPIVFESRELAVRAMFPVKRPILKYEERERRLMLNEISCNLDSIYYG